VTDNPWWGEIFDDHEIADLQNITDQAIEEHDDEEEDDDDYIEAYIAITLDKMCDVLNDIRRIIEANITVTDTGTMFMRSLGEALALEWMLGPADYDEPTADAAQWFLPESD